MLVSDAGRHVELAELNKSYENRETGLRALKVDPLLDPLRDDRVTPIYCTAWDSNGENYIDETLPHMPPR